MANLENLISTELERFKVPGAAVSVLHHGEVVLEKGFGLRNLEQKARVTEETLFPIGSTTKAFTATLLGTFVDEGLLEWDRPVIDHFPAFRLHDPLVTQQVTLRDMLSHRTGLPRHDMLMFMYGAGGLSRAELVERLRHLPLNKGLREEWQYNNLVYMTAGHLTEVVAGISWEDALAQRLLDPLGMTHTVFSNVEMQKSEDHSRPHAEKDGRVIEVPFRVIEMVGPAGSLNSSIGDMTRWLRLNLGEGRVEDRQVVSAATLTAIQSPAMVIPAPMPWPEINLVGYGLGWVIEDYRGHRVIWHNGGVDGFKAIVAMVPREKLGVVVLANKFPSEAPEAIAYRLFDELLGLEPVDWGARRAEIEAAMATETNETVEKRSAAAKNTPPTHPLKEYAGTYFDPGYGRISFEVVDGELGARLHDLDVTLHHRHLNVWDAQEKAHDLLMPVVFQVDADGEIARVEIELEPTVAPIVFVRESEETD